MGILRVAAESLDGLLTGGHAVGAEELVEVVQKPLGGSAEVDGVLGLQLADDLFGQNIVQGYQLVATAGDEDGDIRVDLLHNAVTEGDVEVLDEVGIQHLEALAVAAADGVLGGGGGGSDDGEVIWGLSGSLRMQNAKCEMQNE